MSTDVSDLSVQPCNTITGYPGTPRDAVINILVTPRYPPPRHYRLPLLWRIKSAQSRLELGGIKGETASLVTVFIYATHLRICSRESTGGEPERAIERRLPLALRKNAKEGCKFNLPLVVDFT